MTPILTVDFTPSKVLDPSVSPVSPNSALFQPPQSSREVSREELSKEARALLGLQSLPPEEQLKVLRIIKARRSPINFNEYCFTNPKGVPWKLQSFHREWLELILQHLKIQIEAFRESAKTEQISIGYVLYRLGKEANIRIKVVSADDGLAKAIIGAAGEHIESNSKLREVFPKLRPANQGQWNKEKLFIERDQIMKDASLEAHGVLASGVGGRCDLLVFDDVCNFRNTVLQPAMKPLVLKAVQDVWMKLVTPGGQIIWIDTPWAHDDASATMRKDNSFFHIKHSVYKRKRSKETGEVYETSRWPEKYSNEYLKEEENARPISFKTQMRLQISASEIGAYFPASVIENCQSIYAKPMGGPELGHLYVSFWDLGRHVNRKGRNASVCVVLDITDTKAFIRHAQSYINVPYTTPGLQGFSVASEIVRITNTYPGEHVVEINAAGEAVMEGLDVVITPFRTTVKTKVPMMQNLLNELTRASIQWFPTEALSEMVDQLSNYTLQDDNLAQDWVISLAGASLFIRSEANMGMVI